MTESWGGYRVSWQVVAQVLHLGSLPPSLPADTPALDSVSLWRLPLPPRHDETGASLCCQALSCPCNLHLCRDPEDPHPQEALRRLQGQTLWISTELRSTEASPSHHGITWHETMGDRRGCFCVVLCWRVGAHLFRHRRADCWLVFSRACADKRQGSVGAESSCKSF